MFLYWVGFFSIGGGSEISGVPPSQVYLNGTALIYDVHVFIRFAISNLGTVLELLKQIFYLLCFFASNVSSFG